MPSFRRPPRTLISGLGVAGAVLAAVVVTFAVASSIVAYSLTSADPLPRPSGALVLDPLRPAVVTARPLVLRRAHVAAPRRSAAATAGSAGPSVAAVSVRDTGAGGLAPRAGRHSVVASEPQRGDDDHAAAPAQPAPDRLLKPVGDAIGATGQAVGTTTDSLARRLDGVTAAVGAHTAPAARTVGSAADAAAEVLGSTADRSGKVVDRLLGETPRR